MSLRQRFLTLLVFVPLLAAGLRAEAVSFTSTNAGFLDGIPLMLGWQFEVTASIQVTQLGFQDYGSDGLVTSHEVGIWQDSDQSLLGSVIVQAGTASTLNNFFRYELITPILLVPGQLYVIGGFDPANTDLHVWDAFLTGYNNDVNGFTVDPLIQLGGVGTARFAPVAVFSFPGQTTGDTRSALLGPNFQFTAVPEPGTWIGFLGLAAMWAAKKKSRQ